MGWLKERFGETNTAIGAGIVYAVVRQSFPQYAAVIDSIAGLLGVGMMAMPQR